MLGHFLTLEMGKPFPRAFEASHAIASAVFGPIDSTAVDMMHAWQSGFKWLDADKCVRTFEDQSVLKHP
jgi:hypothetical protein